MIIDQAIKQGTIVQVVKHHDRIVWTILYPDDTTEDIETGVLDPEYEKLMKEWFG